MSSAFVPIETATLDWRHEMPFSIQYDDIYFSAGNGLEQGRFTFLDGNRLTPRWLNLHPNTQFNIAETGFGTGLNFLLTWQRWEQYAPQSCRLHFITTELHPLSLNDLIRSLNLWPELAPQANQLIEKYPILTPGYHHLTFDNGRITLTLMLGDALECFDQLLICGDSILESKIRTNFIDAWYLDGFNPEKNEGMWSGALINCIAMLSKEGTTLATYTVAAPVKTALTKAGFAIEKKKGFGPKRHMITAEFKTVIPMRTKSRSTPWHLAIATPANDKSAVIIGAGLAGCFTAHSLAKRGWMVTVIDELAEAGQGGSANTQGVLFPKLSAYKSPLTEFMLLAFIYAVETYTSLLNQFSLGELQGSLLLAYNEKESKAQTALHDWLHCYPELGKLVDAEEGSVLSGLPIEKNGLYLPLSGWINTPELCRLLLEHPNIILTANQPISELKFHDGKWSVSAIETQTLILANGPKINSFAQTQHLAIKAIRGQMTEIATNNISNRLKIPVCAEGHVLPELNGLHRYGATYDLNNDKPEIRASDDIVNTSKLGQIVAEILWSKKITGHWAGVRASTSDYLPLVGPIAKAEDFLEYFVGLQSNSKRWIAQAGPYHPGLYACAGFGSRGLTSIPLAAEWLAATINNEISCLPRHLIQAISPARFLRKTIVRGLI